jgi:hypothetical protein
MIYDYYNIICENCNSRLLNIKDPSSNFYIASCNCGEIIFSSRKENPGYEMHTAHLILSSGGRLFQTLSPTISYFYDMPYQLISKTYGNVIEINSIIKQRYNVNSILDNLFSKDEIFELIGKPYLSESYNEIIKIIKVHNNNLIFE